MRDVLVVGSLNVDISVRADHLPGPGETVRADDLTLGPGGKGLNQAIAAARLGGRVHMVGRVGEDDFAEIPLRALRDAGVNTDAVAVAPGEHTGTALISVDATTGENAIAVAAGANRSVTAEHVADAIGAFRAASVLLTQLELPLETVRAALELAKQSSMRTVLDPAPYRELPDDLVRQIDVLTPNASEAAALSGRPVSDLESAIAAGTLLRERTGGDVVVTLGEQDCVWVSATGFQQVPAPTVCAVDTTACGDAFNGALGVALARAEPLAQALHAAVRAGSAAALRRGAAASMPARADVERLSA